MATANAPAGHSSAHTASTPLQQFVGLLYALADVVLLVGLIAAVGLFADFLVYQGRLPHLGQLPPADQRAALAGWKDGDADSRRAKLQAAGIDAARPEADAGPDARRKAALIDRLLAKEAAPLIAEASEADLQAWDRANGPFADPYWSALTENELRWQVELRALLRERIPPAPEALPLSGSAGRAELPSPAGPLPGAGIYGLLARNAHHWTFPLIAAWAKVMPWLTVPGEMGLNARYLDTLIALAVLLCLARWAVSLLINRHASYLTVDAAVRLRRGIYHHCHRLGNLSLRGDGTGGASNLFTRQVEAVQDDLYVRLATEYRYWIAIVALVALALAAQFWLALAALCTAVAGAVFLNAIDRTLRKRGKQSSRRARAGLSRLIESLKIMRLVRSYSMQTFNQARLERQLADYERQQLKRYRYDGAVRPAGVLFTCVLGFLVLFLAAQIERNRAVGAFPLTVMALALAGLYSPIRTLLGRRRYRRRALHAEDEIAAYFARESKVREAVDGEFLDVVRKSVRFEDVTLRDADDRSVLKHLEMTVAAGSKVGLVGADEIEKRAVLYLLMRLNDPKSGSVRMDGKDLKWVSKDSLRMQVGVILQEHLVFNDTVANNIGCGEAEIPLPRIIEAAKLAHAHQFVQKLPHGYETVIGEFGHPLTVGQQYRLALARCALRDPSVLLIEEPTTPLDEETKELLADSIDRFFGDRTVIYIPHRISTLKACDMLYLIEDGRVAASGNHRDLLHESPLYKHLYYMEFNQFGEGG